MIANEVWIDAIIQRPVIRLRTSSSARRPDSVSKRRSLVRPPHRLTEQDPGDGE